MRVAVTFHRFPEEFQCRFAIPSLGDIAFKHLTLVIYGAPQVVGFTVDLYEHLVQMPLPIRMSTKVLNPFSSDLGGEHRAEPVPPKPHRFVADIDATFMQQILDIAKGKWKPDIHHHRQADDLWAGFEIPKRGAFCHPVTLVGRLARLKLVSSDTAPFGHQHGRPRAASGTYAPFNDGSVREWQKHSIYAGKNFANSGSWGPWIATADVLPPVEDLHLTVTLNGETLQSAYGQEMIFSLPEQIAYASSLFTLHPGDVIATGSPDGTGGSRVPKKYLRANDVLTISIQGIGTLSNAVS